MPSKLSHDDFISKAKSVHKNRYVYIDTYINASTKMRVLCEEHGEFLTTPRNHIHRKSGCPSCVNLKRLSVKDFLIKANKKHNNKFQYPDIEKQFKNVRSKITILCPKHREFEQLAQDHLYGYGCPICKESKGEIETRIVLQQLGFEFLEQKTFPDCKGCYRLLPFDFWIPSINTLIEFDGEQHYKPKFGEEQFIRTQINDKTKTKYCECVGIKLIRVPYTELGNVTNYLKKELGT